MKKGRIKDSSGGESGFCPLVKLFPMIKFRKRRELWDGGLSGAATRGGWWVIWEDFNKKKTFLRVKNEIWYWSEFLKKF